jgi:hypothetical protein
MPEPNGVHHYENQGLPAPLMTHEVNVKPSAQPVELLRPTVRMSPTFSKLATALAKAQLKMSNASKDQTNPAFKSKYADLAAVREACMPPMNENGIAVIQTPSANDVYAVTVVTLLIHESGEWLENSLTVRAAKQDAQGIGSAITYLRRYQLLSIAGIAPDDDDDGNGASGNGRPHPTAQTNARAYEQWQQNQRNHAAQNGSNQPNSQGDNPQPKPDTPQFPVEVQQSMARCTTKDSCVTELTACRDSLMAEHGEATGAEVFKSLCQDQKFDSIDNLPGPRQARAVIAKAWMWKQSQKAATEPTEPAGGQPEEGQQNG